MSLESILEKSGLYYYITMKEFERDYAHKSDRKSVRLTAEEKKTIHENVLKNPSSYHFLTQIRRKIKSNKADINNYDELFDFFSNVNICDYFDGVEVNKNFECKLIEGNFAWISKSDNGHYRYFSKPKEGGKVIGLDFIDLAEILYGKTTTEVIHLLVKDLGIKFMDNIWINEQNNKYMSNLTLIHRFNKDKELIGKYPELYEIIKEHLKVLETINVIGSINIKKQEYSFKGQNIFFSSNSYIADFLGNYTKSTINKIINLFAVLGLIVKIPEAEIQPQLLHESKMICKKRQLGNIISYYIVPSFLDVFPEANKRAEVLLDCNIKYHNITKAKIEYVFGKDFANQIYVQEIQKNKSNTAMNLMEELERNIKELIDKQGYATKKQVADIKIKGTTKKQRISELDKSLNSIIASNDLKFIKPTLEMKSFYNLKTNEYILINM